MMLWTVIKIWEKFKSIPNPRKTIEVPSISLCEPSSMHIFLEPSKGTAYWRISSDQWHTNRRKWRFTQSTWLSQEEKRKSPWNCNSPLVSRAHTSRCAVNSAQRVAGTASLKTDPVRNERPRSCRLRYGAGYLPIFLDYVQPMSKRSKSILKYHFAILWNTFKRTVVYLYIISNTQENREICRTIIPYD